MAYEVSDPLRILAGMRAHDVRYILVGGLAAAAHGSPIETDEVEVVISGDQDNLKHLALVLEDLDARPRPLSEGDEYHMSFQTVAGDLDCAEVPTGVTGFSDLYARATDLDVGQGVVVRVASLDDLAELKRASGDLSAAAHLSSFHQQAEVTEAPTAKKERRFRRREPGELTRRERLWKTLEDVDRMLTEFDERKPRPSEPKT